MLELIDKEYEPFSPFNTPAVKANNNAVRQLSRVLCYVVLLAAIIIHSACAADRPNHANALTQINKTLGDEEEYAITNLKYVNGYQKDANDYVVSVSYTRVFKVSSTYFSNQANEASEKYFHGQPDPSQKNDLGAALAAAAATRNAVTISLAVHHVWGDFEVGDSFDETCDFRFLLTENGWLIQGTEGDAVIVEKHLGAGGVDARKRQIAAAQAAQEARERFKVQQDAWARASELQREAQLMEVKNACVSGQQVKVGGRVSLMGENNNALWYGPTPGQVVFCDAPTQILHFPGRPVEHNDYMCHIKYSSGKQVITGYTQCSELFVIK